MDTQKIEEQLSLTGKAALVTGAGSNIGRSIAMALADADAHVVLVAESNLDEAKELVDLIRADGGSALLLEADVGSAEDAEQIVQAAVDSLGGLDILVNVALAPQGAYRTVGGLWEKAAKASLNLVSFYCRAAARHMIQLGRGGKMINVASLERQEPSGISGDSVRPQMNIAILSRMLAEELDPYGITVNALAPNLAETNRNQMQAVGLIANPVDAGRVGGSASSPRSLSSPEGDEVATVVLFLLTPAASGITGQLVSVNGSL
jgi:3-oxoacyl-[acyl-carrier protein] reductase